MLIVFVYSFGIQLLLFLEVTIIKSLNSQMNSSRNIGPHNPNVMNTVFGIAVFYFY